MADLHSVRIEQEDFNEDDSCSILSVFFDGFLTIGTLGSDHSIDSEPETPTFATSVGSVTEEETELTENDLKLINEELENVLIADSKNDHCCNDTSGRTSPVSSITLGLDGSTDHRVVSGANGAAFPLQGYLFGSPIDLPSRTNSARKENRTSLGELFRRSKMEEKAGGENKDDKRDSSGEKTVKKMLKWRSFRGCSGAANSVSAENKLHKLLLQIFNKKVHPESSTTIMKRSHKSHKSENNDNISSYEGDYYNADSTVPDEDAMLFPQNPLTQRERAITTNHLQRYKRHQSNSPPLELNGSDVSGKREYWIKTDANYLVLEL